MVKKKNIIYSKTLINAWYQWICRSSQEGKSAVDGQGWNGQEDWTSHASQG